MGWKVYFERELFFWEIVYGTDHFVDSAILSPFIVIKNVLIPATIYVKTNIYVSTYRDMVMWFQIQNLKKIFSNWNTCQQVLLSLSDK